MSRKPIQIAAYPENEFGNAHIIALCDDGSIWSYELGEWKLVTPIMGQKGFLTDEDMKTMSHNAELRKIVAESTEEERDEWAQEHA